MTNVPPNDGASDARPGDHEHLRELLNASLDDALTPDERVELDAALAASPALRRELDELRATSVLLRSLPEVSPPAAVVAPAISLADHPRRHRRWLAPVLAAAACVAAVLGVGAVLDPMPVAPPIDELALRHGGQVEGFDEMDGAAMNDPAVLDTIGDGMDRAAVFERGDLVQTVYSDGAHDLSMFHEPGVVDWNALPADGSMTETDGSKAWTGRIDDTVVAVTERGDLVVTVVADADMGIADAGDMAMHASDMMPKVSIDRGLWRRIVEGPANLIDRI